MLAVLQQVPVHAVINFKFVVLIVGMVQGVLVRWLLRQTITSAMLDLLTMLTLEVL